LLTREQSSRDARVAHLRLTDEGEQRLAQAFTNLARERADLRDAFRHLDSG
jgi:DNA-binding MarR family transcriptional regulator